MAEIERLSPESDAEPPARVLDGGFEVPDGGVAAEPDPAAISERGKPLLVDDLERDSDSFDHDLEIEVREDQRLAFLSRRDELDAVAGDAEVAAAEREGEVSDPVGDRVGFRRGEAGVSAGEEVEGGGKQEWGRGDGGCE